ncbi:DUF6498-containing protein [Cytophaga aurantiaca]|uniref:DUF6498-containing protein n=1 Tax=Cytophaga aurantiaca TaxID=29530 RepID=UPI00037C8A60|nr:DUF6498-containing protein [Cytophaga aurantiaca]
MNKNSAAYLIDILSLLFFTVLTIVAVVVQEITIFYVIYIFWWDEFIKVLFDFFRYLFNKKEIETPLLVKASIGSRFFMLFIYIVFIIVCFGFIIEWNTENAISKNAQILLFQNIYFNISLISFIGREIYVYRNKVQTINKVSFGMMSGSLITLHVSIILGILLWAVATKKLGSIPFELGSYSTILAIIPFLIIKFLFEWLTIRMKRKEVEKSNLE